MASDNRAAPAGGMNPHRDIYKLSTFILGGALVLMGVAGRLDAAFRENRSLPELKDEAEATLRKNGYVSGEFLIAQRGLRASRLEYMGYTRTGADKLTVDCKANAPCAITAATAIEVARCIP